VQSCLEDVMLHDRCDANQHDPALPHAILRHTLLATAGRDTHEGAAGWFSVWQKDWLPGVQRLTQRTRRSVPQRCCSWPQQTGLCQLSQSPARTACSRDKQCSCRCSRDGPCSGNN
jgi:hypothetical protein